MIPGASGKGHIPIIDVPRARDEEVLDWLALRDAGQSYNAIARAYGKNPGAVQAAIKAIHKTMENDP